MVYIISAIMLLWAGMTRSRNTDVFPMQDVLLVGGAVILVYGLILLVWNYRAGIKYWWL